VDKGWGYELWLVNKSYCGKLLHFQRGKKCSWHFHCQKDEVFFLHSGRLRLRFGWADELALAQSVLLPGLAFCVPVGLRHQMEAEEDSDLFEFSCHHEEADSIRLLRGD
jgi:mannose-6-phosphate isomerase-like protein (cupin superfamily)